MISRLIFLLFCGHIALKLGNALKLPRAKRQNLKVQINTTDDTICMKYLRLSPNTKLEGFILGYGSSFFSNQYIPLPSEGKSYVTEVDAEPRYLITVRPAPIPNHKKSCSGKTKTQKPLQLVIGTLSPTSVFLSWGILVNPQHDWTSRSSCASDRFYTVRYREKDKTKKWGFQLCPTTETVVDNLKPNTLYEFGVKDNTENGIWSKVFNHKTIASDKNKGNGQLQNTYQLVPYSQTQFIPQDMTQLVYITTIKEVIQNITHRIPPKTMDKPSLGRALLVRLIVPGLNVTQHKPGMLNIAESPKKRWAMNETQKWPAESKTPEVQEIASQPLPAMIEPAQESIKPTVPVPEKSEVSQAHSESELESTESTTTPTPELPMNTLATSETDSGLEETKSTPKPEVAQIQNILVPNSLPEFPKTKTSPSLQKPRRILCNVSNEIQLISSGSKISDAPKILQTKPATKKPAMKAASFPSMETPETVMAFDEIQLVSSRSKTSAIPENLPTISVTIQTTPKPVTPEASKAEVATNNADLETSVPLISRVPHLLGTTMAFDDALPSLSSPSTFDEPDISDLKPAARSEPTWESFSPKSSSPLEWPRETSAPNETPFIPSKVKPSPLPEVRHVKPAQNPSILESSTPKAPKTIGWPKATLASWETKFIPSTPKPSIRPKIPRTKPAEKAIHLESNTPKFSKSLEMPTTTLVPSKTKLISSKPKVSLHPEEPKTKLAATREPVPVPVPSKISSITATTKTLEHPKSTTVSYEPEHIPLKPKVSASVVPEMPHSKPAKSPTTPEATRKVSSNDLEWPRATSESSEIYFTPLKHKSPTEPNMPQSTPAPTETQFIASKPKTSPEPELPHSKPGFMGENPTSSHALKMEEPAEWEEINAGMFLEPITLRIEPPRSTIAPKDTQRVPLKPKTSPKPHMPQAKPVLETITFRTEQPKTPLAPKEVQRIPSKPKTSLSPDVSQTKSALRKTEHVPPKPKTLPVSDVPPTKAAMKENRKVPSKAKISSSPDVPQTKPVVTHTTFSVEQPRATIVPKETQWVPSKLKTPPSPDVLPTKPAGVTPSLQEPATATTHSLERAKGKLASDEKEFIPAKPKTSSKPEIPQNKSAIHRTSLPPFITKPSVTSKQAKATMVPNETYQISFKPQTALTTENPQLKTASFVIPTEPIKPLISKPFGKTEATLAPHKVRLTSARPKISDKTQTRPAPNKTTPGPGRTKTAGVMRLGGTPAVTTLPDHQRPPLASAKPTQLRRKPLPPNTVTGRPGSPGIISKSRASTSPVSAVGKPTGPTMPLKTEIPRKMPTAVASPVNATVFSLSPTTETDSQGNTRFTAPYIRYISKPEDKPCSITDTLRYFPETEGDNQENATSPPQNPPSNLTVVTVEGCPSFVVLNWTKPDNDTVTEYAVVSTENGTPHGKEQSILTTNQTHSTVENLKPNTSYEFQVIPKNVMGEGPSSPPISFSTESADPRVSEPISMGKDAIWTEIPFNSDSFSECKGKMYVKRTWYKKFVGVQLCNSLRYKIYLSNSLTGEFYNIGDQRGYGEDHCQFVDSFLDGRTGLQVFADQLPTREGFFRAVRQEPVKFGKIGGHTHITYVSWYECGTSIPGQW